MRGELPGQLVEQLGVARRVLVAQVVDRVDQAGAEEQGPDPVDRGAGEVRVVAATSPSRPGSARATPCELPVGLAAVEEAGLDHLRRCRGSPARGGRGPRGPGRSRVALARRSTPAKKAASAQNWSRFQCANGWSWHWAHSSRTPRKTRAVLAARFSGLPSFAA